MKKAVVLLLVIEGAFLSLLFAQTNRSDKKALTLYRQAVKSFEVSEPTRATDSLAASYLLRVVGLLEPKAKNGFVLFDCYEKLGVLKQTYGNQPEAIVFYQQAIASCFSYKLADSLLFKPYLHSGTAHYYLHSFDSSTYYFKKAEAILSKFPLLEEAQQLYNAFGALYYEAGNYQQSVNYFQKAIQLNQRSASRDKAYNLYGFKSNIASALVHLEQYDAAASTYRSMISPEVNQNELWINLGTTYAEKENPDSALYYLSKVSKASKTDVFDPVTVENTLGIAFLQKGQLETAFVHLNKALEINKKNQIQNGFGQKDNDAGLTYKLLADGEQKRQNLKKALRYYQQSIIQLDDTFNDTVIYHNPSNSTTGFRSYLLFESLAAKASCLQKLYEAEATSANLNCAIETYQSALKLAEYIEKSFDSEDAQLFIVRKVFPVYQRAVAFMAYSFERTRDKTYLERAFCWAEKSKAVALHINLKDNELKSYTGLPDSLVKKERNLKFNLSRLLLNIDRATSKTGVTALTLELRDNELALSRLADKLNEYPEYHKRKFSFDTISIPYLQQKLINESTALVSYFQGTNDVFCFVITRRDVRYHKSRKDSLYTQALSNTGTQLRTAVPGVVYQGSSNTQLLYDRLIKSAEPDLNDISSLIIIPHDELILLPFEILEDSNKTYLLEKFDITYQYAASLFQDEIKSDIDFHNMLAVAPFDSIVADNGSGLARLPASDKEIVEWQGVKLTHQTATKENFIRLTETASIIHLATHAVANNEDPLRSYIAFYPTQNENDKLYAHELRNAPLSKTHLVFLSACETASGKLISGEGVMSLSRAISYAGCPSLITSLWKADDNATAYISARFYVYLKQGNSFPQALRKAKIDILRDGQYAQYHSPQYWSHLVFIGTSNKANNSFPARFWTVVGLVVLASLLTSLQIFRREG